MSATSVLSKSTQKSKKYPYNPVFFILSTEKSFETLANISIYFRICYFEFVYFHTVNK